MTAPLRDWQVVLGKYVACFGFYVVLWLPTLVYLPVLLDLRAVEETLQSAWTAYRSIVVAGAVSPCWWLACCSSRAFGRGCGSLRRPARWVVPAVAVGMLVHYTTRREAPARRPRGLDPWPVLTIVPRDVPGRGDVPGARAVRQSSLVRRPDGGGARVAGPVGLVFVVAGVLAAGTWTPGRRGRPAGLLLQRAAALRRDFTRGLIDTRPLVLYADAAPRSACS